MWLNVFQKQADLTALPLGKRQQFTDGMKDASVCITVPPLTYFPIVRPFAHGGQLLCSPFMKRNYFVKERRHCHRFRWDSNFNEVRSLRAGVLHTWHLREGKVLFIERKSNETMGGHNLFLARSFQNHGCRNTIVSNVLGRCRHLIGMSSKRKLQPSVFDIFHGWPSVLQTPSIRLCLQTHRPAGIDETCRFVLLTCAH